jgi:hypothetical protein
MRKKRKCEDERRREKMGTGENGDEACDVKHCLSDYWNYLYLW